MGKHSVVVQLPLDPDPGGVSPLLSSHLLPEGRGTLASTLSPHVPRVAQLSLGVSQYRTATGQTAPVPHASPACPRDHTPHTQVGTAAQSVSSEGDSARVFQCKPLQGQAVPAACGADPACTAGLHPDAVPCPDPSHSRVRQFQVKGGCLLLKGLHIRQRCPNRHLPGCEGPMTVSSRLLHHRAPGFPVCACWSDCLNPAFCTKHPPLPMHSPL